MKDTTGSRLKQIMRENHLKQVDILTKTKHLESELGTKITKADLSQYVNDKVEPGQDKLYVLAKALDVSEAWLMGYEVPRERMTDELRNAYVHNNRAEAIAAHIDDDVSEEDMEEIINYIEYRKRLAQKKKGE